MLQRTILVAVAVLFLVGLVSAEDKPMVSWRTQELTLDNPVRAADQLLPAGDYRVTHEMEGERHIMVFALQGKEKKQFRVVCTMEPLLEKASADEQYARRENGGRVLTTLIFKGDTVRHVF